MADENPKYLLQTTSPQKTSSVHLTSDPLLQAILNKIESGAIDPRNVDWNAILAVGKLPGTTSLGPTDEALSGFNLGLLIPLVIVSIFMVVLLLCTIRHSWSNRCRIVPKKKHSFSSLSRHPGESLRSSTRSSQLLQEGRGHHQNDSLDRQRSMLLPPVITKVGILGSIRESPEDKYKTDKATTSQGDADNTPGSTKSVSSAFSNVLTDFPYIISNIGAYPVSVHPGCKQTATTQSHLNLGQEPPFVNPYHITWITPGMSQSDPMLSTNGMTELESKLGKGFACKIMQQVNPNTPPNQKQVGKSPYHPNYNTPTNGSENDENMPANVVINGPNSLVAPTANIYPSIPVRTKPEIPTLRGMPNLPTLLLHRQSIPSCNGSTPTTCNGSKVSSFDATCASAQLSCPSSVGSWQYNDVYNQPAPQGMLPVKNLLTQALLNSASRPVSGEILDPNHFLNDHQNQMNYTTCQPSIASMFPNVGSSNNSFQNNLQQPRHLNQTDSLSQSGGEQMVLPAQSTNTSLCGHMDSCETSENYSSMATSTGINSEQVSGYIAGPSHSTSIERNSTLSNNYTNQSSILNSGSSSTETESSAASSIQAISAIQNSTVNSEASTGQQIFHQALSLDGTNASITLSFASTAKSAPAALHCLPVRQYYLQDMRGDTLSETQNAAAFKSTFSGISSGMSNQVYSTGSGSTTPTVITQLERPISNLSSDPSAGSRMSSTNPFLQSAAMKSKGDGSTAASSGTYEWDFYPFSGDNMTHSAGSNLPEVPNQSAITPSHESTALTASTDPSVTSSSNQQQQQQQHRRRSNQPLLADAQYWV